MIKNVEMKHRFQQTHNNARNFTKMVVMINIQLSTSTTCAHCHARLFYHKSHDMCCLGRNLLRPHVNALNELLQIFSSYSSESRYFRQHMRRYNHVLSFTSLGVHMDENIVAIGCGIYSFRAQGAIYHKIGSLFPNEGYRPCFLQLYIYDIAHKLQNRMLETPQLYQTIVDKLEQILHRCNPCVHVLRQFA